jgi:hypothetical protein
MTGPLVLIHGGRTSDGTRMPRVFAKPDPTAGRRTCSRTRHQQPLIGARYTDLASGSPFPRRTGRSARLNVQLADVFLAQRTGHGCHHLSGPAGVSPLCDEDLLVLVDAEPALPPIDYCDVPLRGTSEAGGHVAGAADRGALERYVLFRVHGLDALEAALVQSLVQSPDVC